MYVSKNFKTKKQLKDAVQAGEKLAVFAPGLGTPNQNGSNCVEGPWYPEPHKWYADVIVKNGVIVRVK